jgi:hypothetical protein
MFSRPDFTVATARQLTYDPLSHLDAITFELKNVTGATLMAVHEALAYTRFSHHSYLVCPRSQVRPGRRTELQEECARHGVGLIMSGLLRDEGKPGLVPDPCDVEELLEACFDTGEPRRPRQIARRGGEG